jgi:hypothetical protein
MSYSLIKSDLDDFRRRGAAGSADFAQEWNTFGIPGAFKEVPVEPSAVQ